METKIAAAYIRVSTEDQTEYSPAAQLRELREYAASHNMVLDERHIYADEGISGRQATKRPKFMQMIADAKTVPRPFDVILVHKFDRFARSREDSIVYKSMLKRVGVEVISIKEPLAEGNYSGVMEAIYESFAEAYSINLGQEVKKGMTEKARRGEIQTAPPFGYRLENHTFVPHETEAPVVQELFRTYASGRSSFFALAKDLNDRGYRTHRGGRFENRTVEYILRNPIYIGKVRWNPAGRSRRNFDDPNILTVDGTHEPIIDTDTWDAVQSRIAEQKAKWRYHGRPSADRHHWLCGIVRCSECGATLIWSKPHYLKCSNYVRGRCRSSQHISAALLEEAVLHQLREDLLTDDTPECRIIRSTGNQELILAQLRQNLQRAEQRRDRLTDAYLNSAIDLTEYARLKTPLDNAVTEAREALEKEEAAQVPIDTKAELRASIEKTIKTLLSPQRTVAEKFDAANSIIESCVFAKKTSTLTLTYRLTV